MASSRQHVIGKWRHCHYVRSLNALRVDRDVLHARWVFLMVIRNSNKLSIAPTTICSTHSFVQKSVFLWTNFNTNLFNTSVCIVFIAMHGMQTRSSDENSVCLSARPSVCQTRALWQNERKISPDFYAIRKFSEKKNGWWGLNEILGQRTLVGAKAPILNR